MIIEAARYADGELHLRCDPREGIQATYKLDDGKDYDIVPHKEKRTLNANSYAWTLIHKIAAELSKPPNGVPTTPIEVYRNAVLEMPDEKAAFISVADIAAPDFIESWEAGHIGRQCEQFDSGTPGFVTIRCVYGSSDYDRAEMALLIDRLVQDAQALGIETRPQEDIDSLLRSWKA